jgi:hypothetical protein
MAESTPEARPADIDVDRGVSLYLSAESYMVIPLGHKPAPVRPRLFDYFRENAGEPITINSMVSHLYGSSPPRCAIHSVRSMITRLRQELEPLGGAIIHSRPYFTYIPGLGGDPIFKGRVM